MDWFCSLELVVVVPRTGCCALLTWWLWFLELAVVLIFVILRSVAYSNYVIDVLCSKR